MREKAPYRLVVGIGNRSRNGKRVGKARQSVRKLRASDSVISFCYGHDDRHRPTFPFFLHVPASLRHVTAFGVEAGTVPKEKKEDQLPEIKSQAFVPHMRAEIQFLLTNKLLYSLII